MPWFTYLEQSFSSLDESILWNQNKTHLWDPLWRSTYKKSHVIERRGGRSSGDALDTRRSSKGSGLNVQVHDCDILIWLAYGILARTHTTVHKLSLVTGKMTSLIHSRQSVPWPNEHLFKPSKRTPVNTYSSSGVIKAVLPFNLNVITLWQ